VNRQNGWIHIFPPQVNPSIRLKTLTVALPSVRIVSNPPTSVKGEH
jgi:hypothetical protein